MRHPILFRRLGLLLILLLLPLLAGCVELTGQRITLVHDAAGDQLILLVAHDGIHEKKGESPKPGAEQLAKYIRQRNLMLFDWWMELKRADLEQQLREDDLRPALRDLLRTALDTIETRPLGHYLDPLGRIGAYQVVVIPQARAFVARINAALAELVLGTDQDDLRPRSLAARQLFAEAKAGHAWLRLEGHSVVISVPYFPREWARDRARFFRKLCEEYADEKEKKKSTFLPDFLVQVVSSEALSIREGPKRLELRLGSPARASTLRGVLRRGYTERLEAAVQELVPEAADAVIAAHLLDPRSSPADDWKLLLDHLPAEDRVRAVLGARSDPARRAAADRWLAGFVATWSERSQTPPVPESRGDREGWRQWYAAMLRYPLDAVR